MSSWIKIGAAAILAAPFIAFSTSAQAGVGDLLVAPTRIVLDGRKGTEIILNNIGDEPATYRISVEFRRMTEDGNLLPVPTPTAVDKTTEDMIIYAPRRVTLAPHEPQSIRLIARPPQGLPDGEYRVHVLFRAIPPATPVVQASAEVPKGVQFKITPVYGVTISVIVRLGNLDVTAGISNVRLEKEEGKPVVALDLSRWAPVDLRRRSCVQGRNRGSDRIPEGGRGLYRSEFAPRHGSRRGQVIRGNFRVRLPCNMSRRRTTVRMYSPKLRQFCASQGNAEGFLRCEPPRFGAGAGCAKQRSCWRCALAVSLRQQHLRRKPRNGRPIPTINIF